MFRFWDRKLIILTQNILSSVHALLQARAVSDLVNIFIEVFRHETEYFARVRISGGPVLPAFFWVRFIGMVEIDVIWA